MIISKKKRNSEEFKKLFCTQPNDRELAREDIKKILLNACAKTEHSRVENTEIVEDEYDDDFDFDKYDYGEVTDEDVAEYIVENPNEVIVNFPLVSDIQLEEKLPFFKSVLTKLNRSCSIEAQAV